MKKALTIYVEDDAHLSCVNLYANVKTENGIYDRHVTLWGGDLKECTDYMLLDYGKVLPVKDGEC